MQLRCCPQLLGAVSRGFKYFRARSGALRALPNTFFGQSRASPETARKYLKVPQSTRNCPKLPETAPSR
eukprot:5100184-Alexandrium_andersonii.AAC.1